jgi:molybdate transport system ATP-binding protein
VSTLSAEIRLRLSSAFQLDCRFEAASGFTVLFGPSGAGKTTVLDCLAGLRIPDSGKIALNEQLFFCSRTGENIDTSRRRFAYVFQSLALFPHMSVRQNVCYGLSREPISVQQQRALEILDQFGIAALRDRLPAELSGGERQRVALARSLVTNPSVLLLDEPLAALDRATRSKIIDDLRRWNQAHSVPILYVTHSHREAVALGERVLLMRAGQIVGSGSPAETLPDDDWE